MIDKPLFLPLAILLYWFVTLMIVFVVILDATMGDRSFRDKERIRPPLFDEIRWGRNEWYVMTKGRG